jgi:hypothetical protein
MVCDKGGTQTRTLKEVHHFIRYQLEYLAQKNKTNTYFINILEGDESHRNVGKFNNIIKREKYDNIEKYIFCGDMNEFYKWYKLNFN